MKCYKCPCIKDQFDYRIQKYDNDFNRIEYDEAEYDHADYCWCDKIGGKLYWGRCDDAERLTKEEWDQYREKHGLPPIINYEKECENKPINIDPIPEPSKKQIKRHRDKKHKEYLKRLSEYADTFSGAYPVGTDGQYDDENPVRYKRLYNPPRAKWIKRDCNKRIRRLKDVAKRGGYRKQSEYSWILW